MEWQTKIVLDRLEILRRKLEDEGLYVRANTAALAIEAIRRAHAALKKAGVE